MNYLETLKNITKNKEKRTENIILLIVLLVIILVASNFIFSDTKNEKSSNSTSSNSNINNSEDAGGTQEIIKSDLESKLSNILSEISGISEVSVVVTYSQDTKNNPIYNTKEAEKSGEKTVEKSVAYNENGSSKTAIIETVEMPKVEGAIIVAKGASTVEIRSKIASAVSTLTNLPVYKVQVFEKQN
mgnify:CR=1 FL=1